MFQIVYDRFMCVELLGQRVNILKAFDGYISSKLLDEKLGFVRFTIVLIEHRNVSATLS